jgi:hypothetical protein
LHNHFSAMTRMGTVMVPRSLTADASNCARYAKVNSGREVPEAVDGSLL